MAAAEATSTAEPGDVAATLPEQRKPGPISKVVEVLKDAEAASSIVKGIALEVKPLQPTATETSEPLTAADSADCAAAAVQRLAQAAAEAAAIATATARTAREQACRMRLREEETAAAKRKQAESAAEVERLRTHVSMLEGQLMAAEGLRAAEVQEKERQVDAMRDRALKAEAKVERLQKQVAVHKERSQTVLQMLEDECSTKARSLEEELQRVRDKMDEVQRFKRLWQDEDSEEETASEGCSGTSSSAVQGEEVDTPPTETAVPARTLGPDAADSRYYPKLVYASERGDANRVMELLADGEDPNTQDPHGMAGLHGAAKKGHVQVAELLLENGASPNLQTAAGDTPLHYACKHQKPALVKLLLEAKADPAIKSNNGRTAFPYMRSVTLTVGQGAAPKAPTRSWSWEAADRSVYGP